MYFTELPDHSKAGFDEGAHFSLFKNHNIIFNAESSNSCCDRHVGCLSFKTVLKGEEIYRFGHQQVAVRPGGFLMLNDEQEYGCRIENGGRTRTLSVFFKKEFALTVLQNASHRDRVLLDNHGHMGNSMPEFFQTLNTFDSRLELQIAHLISSLNIKGNDSWMLDEKLVFLLDHLINTQQAHHARLQKVYASRVSTRKEIYRRLCVAKDYLHYTYHENPDLNAVSQAACLSVPQLVRQFKAVFGVTTHRYLSQLRLRHAAELLALTHLPIYEITWKCGFENISAFSRAFKIEFGKQPTDYRKLRNIPIWKSQNSYLTL
jgi:AraC family transcriptional regulator